MESSRRSAVAALLVTGMLAGCAVVLEPAGPPPHAPAHGARAKMPPRIVVTPAIVVIPGTTVSFAENYADDLFYFEGRWYRPYEGNWYWSVSVSGDWGQIAVGQVPRAVLEVPRDYRVKARKGGPPDHAPAYGRRGKGKDKD